MSWKSEREIVDAALGGHEAKPRGHAPGTITKVHRTAWDGLELAFAKIFPGEKFRQEFILEHALHTIIRGEMSDKERADAMLAMMKFLYPTLKAVDHTGSVTQVNVQLTHEQIASIF
jgi:hypothetical protein